MNCPECNVKWTTEVENKNVRKEFTVTSFGTIRTTLKFKCRTCKSVFNKGILIHDKDLKKDNQ